VVGRLRLPFSLLSDDALRLTTALKLPTFVTSGLTLLKRMAWVLDDGKIIKVFYPVFPPEKSAEEVLFWCTENARSN
jgi:peroxiredoxin